MGEDEFVPGGEVGEVAEEGEVDAFALVVGGLNQVEGRPKSKHEVKTCVDIQYVKQLLLVGQGQVCLVVVDKAQASVISSQHHVLLNVGQQVLTERLKLTHNPFYVEMVKYFFPRLVSEMVHLPRLMSPLPDLRHPFLRGRDDFFIDNLSPNLKKQGYLDMDFIFHLNFGHCGQLNCI